MRYLAIVASVAATVMAGCSDAASQSTDNRAELDRRFETMFSEARNDPELGSGLNTLAATFPADFERFKREAHYRFVSTGDGAQTVYIAQSVIGQVVAREMPNIGRAPDDYLINYAIVVRDAYRVVGEHDPAVCNQIASGMVPDTTKMNIESARAFSRSLAAVLQAAAASRARPVERQLGPPSPAEIDLYVTALSKTDITASEAALIDDPRLIAQADPVTSCRVRRILMDGVINLPPATASRFVAGMLTQNVTERARLATQ